MCYNESLSTHIWIMVQYREAHVTNKTSILPFDLRASMRGNGRPQVVANPLKKVKHIMYIAVPESLVKSQCVRLQISATVVVCHLSVTRVYCDKTTEARITRFQLLAR